MAMFFFNENPWWWDPPSHELPKNGWVTCWEYWMWVPSGSNQKFHQRGRSQYLHRITGRPLVFQLFLVCFAYMIIHDLRISIRLWHSFFHVISRQYLSFSVHPSPHPCTWITLDGWWDMYGLSTQMMDPNQRARVKDERLNLSMSSHLGVEVWFYLDWIIYKQG
jgi:hypothetical protein